MLDFILGPLKRRFGRDKAYYRMVDELFGFVPHNIELYKLALIPRSAALILENGRPMNNERLEFLGDAVIEAVTSDYLYIEFPDRDEGFLTQLRAKLVSRQALNTIAKTLGLDRHVISKSSGSPLQKHIFGYAFEAMMGAIYLDQGYNFTNRLLINRIFRTCVDMEELLAEETDFKSRLIEWCQKSHHGIAFRTRTGKDARLFYTTVLIDEMEMGHGSGTSKKEAEQRAARSVSQGIDEKMCTAVLDRMDKLRNKA